MGRFAGFSGAIPRYLSLRQSQYWAPHRLRRYVEDHLARSLADAAKIPFYADRFDSRCPIPPDRLNELTILPRAEIHSLAASVQALHPSEILLTSRTSGST